MSDDEINAAIAEACGWTDFVVHSEFGLMGIPPDTHGLRTAVDWYTVDLNAMHEAEKALNMQQWRIYLMHLASFMQDICHATAKEKAKAYLKALGKWKEAQP